MRAPPEPVLSEEEMQHFKHGVAQFNAGFYFECHDTLEEVWNGVRGPSRDFFQALIQISVAFYHLTNQNWAGAESMFSRALKRLARYPEHYFGFDVARMRSTAESWLARIREGDTLALASAERPQWRFERGSSSLFR